MALTAVVATDILLFSMAVPAYAGASNGQQMSPFALEAERRLLQVSRNLILAAAQDAWQQYETAGAGKDGVKVVTPEGCPWEQVST